MRLAFLVIALTFYIYVIGGYWYGQVSDRLRYGSWRHFRRREERSDWKPWRW